MDPSQAGGPGPEGPALGNAPVAAPSDDSVRWRRVHKITPFINAWQAITVLFVILFFNQMDTVLEVAQAFDGPTVLMVVLVVIAAILVAVVIALVYSWLAWKRIRYAVSDDAVFYHNGILFRQQRHARLNRIQGVDIVRPLLGRMFGLSAVTIESAGGAKSNITVKFLKDDEAERLRAEVLARAAGLKGKTSGTGVPGQIPEQPVFAVAPEREVYQLSPGDLLLSMLLSGTVVGALLLTGMMIPTVIVQDSFLAMLGALPVAFIGVALLWGRFAGEFGFTLAISPDGLRTRRGLLTTRAQTLPPGRIQAVRLKQPLLWRKKDWWRVEVNVAGYGQPENENNGVDWSRNLLLPVAKRSDALNALWLVLRDLGVDDPDTVVDAALTGTLGDGGFLHSPPSAKWADPIIWKRNGLLITRTALLMRSGRLSRKLMVVPHERTQSLAIRQGPWERKLKIANLWAASVPGPLIPVAAHLPEMVVLRVLFEQAQRARDARAKEGPEEWMRRVGVPETPYSPPVSQIPACPASAPYEQPHPASPADGEQRDGA